MQQDVRDVLKNFKEDKVALSANHTSKFEDLLQQEIQPQKPKKKSFKWLSIAASIVLLISLGIKFYPVKNIEKDTETSPVQEKISLGSISPEFKTIENYYKNSINLEISDLEMTDNNKEIVDGYLLKIGSLTKEYKLLTQELNTNGVNDSTIDALISNLQVRLQLLKRLRKQLQELKNLNNIQNEII
ncbi:MAG: hypothetical protein AB8B78_11975 [Polaribacter sp.]